MGRCSLGVDEGASGVRDLLEQVVEHPFGEREALELARRQDGEALRQTGRNETMPPNRPIKADGRYAAAAYRWC